MFTIVEALGPLVSDPVHDLPALGVDGHALDINVGETEHSQSGGVVATARLESNEAVELSV
jgi:hypothetical protein